MKKRADIQILRGVAVLLVVLFHLRIDGFENGYLGVDIFFVISGFLMAILYDRDSALNFYKKRFARLFPAYIVTVIATLSFGSIILIPQDYSALSDQALSSIFFASNLYFWNLGDYFEFSRTLPLLHLWSLAVEAHDVTPFFRSESYESRLAASVSWQEDCEDHDQEKEAAFAGANRSENPGR